MKKLLTYVVVLTTIVWSVGLFAMPLSVSAAATAGDLIKLQCASGASLTDPCRAVYYLGSNNKRFVFPTEKTYKTWYTDFAGVKTVSATEMASYMIGGNVTYKPGVKLVKVTTDPKVYAVAANGTLKEIGSEAIAKALYGTTWASMVQDIPDSFWTNYTIGTKITAASDYDKAAATAAATSISVDKSLATGGTTVTPSGTGLTVEKAADTPASGIVVSNAARVAFTKVNLTASADGDVTVTNWQVERTGLGTDSTFSSVDILDATTMMPINSNGKTFSSDHIANFTDQFVIPAGTTKTVILAGNMGSLASNGGEVPSLSLKSLTLKGNTSIIGTLPITGNYQTLNGSIVIGSATVAIGAYSNAAQTIEVGRTGYTFLSFKIDAGSAEDVQFSQVKVYQAGSSSWTDLSNIKLYKDGTEIGTGTASGNYVSFSVSPITILKGQTAQFQVKADVANGSGRTVKLGFYRSTDLLVKGLVYGYNVTPSYTGAAASSPILTDSQATIGAGTLRVGRSSSVAAANITVGSDQVLGAFEFEAKGEPIDVTALTLAIASSTTAAAGKSQALTSVKLVDSTGKTICGPVDSSTAGTLAVFSDSFTVPVGLNVYKVVATVPTNANWATNDTITVSISDPSTVITSRGQVSAQTVTPSPASAISVSQQTVKAANLTVTKNSTPTAGNVIVNSAGVKLGSWSFDASNSGEDIRITTLAVRASTTGKVNNLTLKDGTTILQPVNSTPVTSNSANTTSTFALSQPLVITKGTSKTIDLYGDIGSNANAGEVVSFGITSGAAVTATGATTGNTASVSVTANNGAALTIAAAGTLSINLDSSASASSLVVAGTTGVAVSDIRLKATNEAIDVTKLTIEVADGGLTSQTGDYSQIAKLYLKLDGAVVGDASGYTLGAATKSINLERGAFTIPEGNTGKKLTVSADVVQLGTNQPGVANADIKVGLRFRGSNLTAYGNQSNTAATVSYTASTGSAIVIHKAVPQVVIKTPTEKLAATAVLSRADITAVGGSIGIYRMSYQVSTSSGLNTKSYYLTLNTCNGCGGISNGTVLTGTATATYLVDGIETVTLPVASANAGKDFLVIAQGATATIDLKATVDGMTSTVSDSVSTSLLGDTATTSNDAAGSAAAAFGALNQGDFVWSDLNLSEDNTVSGAGLTTKQWYNGNYVSGLGNITTTTGVTVGD